MFVWRHAMWTLPRSALRAGVQGGGEYNERPDVNPFDNKELPWKEHVLYPGDVMVIPAYTWHFVLSDPQTLMVNVWHARRRVTAEPEGAPHVARPKPLDLRRVRCAALGRKGVRITFVRNNHPGVDGRSPTESAQCTLAYHVDLYLGVPHGGLTMEDQDYWDCMMHDRQMHD